MYRPIIYDLETTGLDIKTARIVEIAMYDVNNNKMFHSLINPRCQIPKEAEKIHNISMNMIKNEPTFNKIINTINNVCKGKIILVSYNGKSYDNVILKNEYLRNNKKLSSKILYLDIYILIKWMYPELLSYKLKNVLKYFKINENNNHRAKDDVLCLYQLCQHIIKDYNVTYSDMYTYYQKVLTKIHPRYWNNDDKLLLQKMYESNININIIMDKLNRTKLSILFQIYKQINNSVYKTNYIKENYKINKITKLLDKKYKITDICNEYDCYPYVVINQLITAKKLGITIDLTSLLEYPSEDVINNIINSWIELGKPKRYWISKILRKKYSENNLKFAIELYDIEK